MNESDCLESIESMLKEENFDCSLEPYTKSPPFGRVLLYLGNDSQGRERILEITAQHQEMGESLRTPAEEPKFTRIQFQILLPFHVKDICAGQAASLIAFLNRMLELPGFEFDEVHSKIYYRYVLLTARKGIDKTILSGIVGVVLLLLEMFTETIERIAEGKNTFNELLEKVLEAADKMG